MTRDEGDKMITMEECIAGFTSRHPWEMKKNNYYNTVLTNKICYWWIRQKEKSGLAKIIYVTVHINAEP